MVKVHLAGQLKTGKSVPQTMVYLEEHNEFARICLKCEGSDLNKYHWSQRLENGD
jgi:hypothetical protein